MGPWDRDRWRLRVACLAVLGLGLGMGAGPALGKEAKPKPDLVITAGELEGNSYTFWNEKDPISVDDITKNVGKRRAGPTLTRVYLVHGAKTWLLVQRAVPALAPGKEHHDKSTSDIDATQSYPIGAYTLRICADGKHQVDESNETNCRRLLPRHFFVIPRGWVGPMSGIETTSGITTRWQVPKAQLQFDQFEPGGVVSYLFTGTVTWSTSGTAADGCAMTGTGSRSYDNDDSIGALSVDYLHETYSASLQDTSGPPYQVTFSGCDHPPPSQPGPYEPTFWLPSVASTVALPFGSESLPGSPTQNAFGATYTWTLRAAHAL